MTLFLGVQYAIIIYLAIVMALKMQLKLSCLSKRVQLMHRQFYHALVLQITAPTVTLFFPVFILYFVPYLSIEISFPTGTCLSAFALYPAMDICIMIYIASYYNKALKDFLKAILGLFWKKMKTSKMEVNSSVQVKSISSRVVSNQKFNCCLLI
ncbi:hypothetical protein GCK72_020072 [Caenorhabditis remanei]|uniref:Uncharacterized protein n=1 Tax=Caenorhabditis remanei TaxID=31234 RepID=A0A6A5GFP5_CAERE|nr:hypothetical protein GCK72_020072 [Caenorhabditis remanei]KAF1753515.1 hypothetical protein GCK72_020072 [Caenorhabditis remanei]